MNTLSKTAIICIETGPSTFSIINGCLDKKYFNDLYVENVSEPNEALELIDDLVEDGLTNYLLITNESLLSESEKFITQKIKSEYPEVQNVNFSNASSRSIRKSLQKLIEPSKYNTYQNDFSQMSA